MSATIETVDRSKMEAPPMRPNTRQQEGLRSSPRTRQTHQATAKAGLLASGSAYFVAAFPSGTLIRAVHRGGIFHDRFMERRSSPVTAAGPRRIYTVLPYSSHDSES